MVFYVLKIYNDGILEIFLNILFPICFEIYSCWHMWIINSELYSLWIHLLIYPFSHWWTFRSLPVFLLQQCCRERFRTCCLGYMLGCGGHTTLVLCCHHHNKREAISPWLASAWDVYAFYFSQSYRIEIISCSSLHFSSICEEGHLITCLLTTEPHLFSIFLFSSTCVYRNSSYIVYWFSW